MAVYNARYGLEIPSAQTLNIVTPGNWQMGGVAYTGSMANLNTLRDDSMADALHRHSELSASDGTPNAQVQMTAAGEMIVGHTASVASVWGLTPLTQIHGTNNQLGLYAWSADNLGPVLLLGKSRSATKGTASTVNDDDVLGQLAASGADGTDLATIAANIIFRVNGTPGANDIPGEIQLATYDGGVQTGSLIIDAAGSLTVSTAASTYLYFSLNAPANMSTYLSWNEGGSLRYYAYYTATGNYWAIQTTDSDGGGTDADVVRIPDGQLTVDGNSTFDSNAFHYIHECGWHGIDDVGTCPRCGGGPIEWQDDVRLMAEAVQPTLRSNPVILSRLEKLGIINTYGGADLFISMNKSPWFLMSGLVQERGLREQEEASLREELALLQGRLAQAEGELRVLRN